MTDLRPISLCSVYYKIISKILVKRLQPYLPVLVSPFQSAFVLERQIADNILVAHEIVHGLKTNQSLAEEYMAIKSDMSKAYDRVEWEYVKALLEALGFSTRWVQLVMFCISSVSYSVLINNIPFGDIKPSRGLRQGDPLSPALFVLCTEGLSHLLGKAEVAGSIEGVRFSEDGPGISHLLFADDSLFMCKAVGDQARVLKSILQVYGSATGQVVNLDKSSISFGNRIAPVVRKEIQDLFGIYNEGGVSKYLGLPECFSGSKVDLLNYIVEKLKSRLSGWFARSLSLGDKEILLKAVALALPVYAMGCFKLPKSTLSKLTAAMAQFWWNSIEHRKKIHWFKWEKLCLPKSLGGLGFKDLESFNQALLAKQAWKILQEPECILSRFLKSRYFPVGVFTEAKLGSRPSFGWRSILFGRELLLRGLRKEIGNGQSLKVWIDPWCDFGGRFNPWMKNPLIDLELRVSDLLDPSSGTWNVIALEENFFQGDRDIISKINPVPDSEDFWCWKHNISGEYSVKSGYWLASRSNLSVSFSEAAQLPSINPLKVQAWSALTEPKIKSFMWRVLSDIVPVAVTLLHRGMKIDQRCNCCGFEGESVNHVLFTCHVARQIWALSDFPSPESGFHQSSVFVNMSFLFQMSKNIRIPREIRRLYPWILWFLWKNRNKGFFEGLVSSGCVLIEKIRMEANLWFAAQEEEPELSREAEEPHQIHNQKWSKPKERWRKCNVGVCWVSKTRIAGCAWVLRDHCGEVIMHGRRSFSDIQNLKEARLTSLLWAIESMNALRLDGILFAADDREHLDALERPKAWPSFRYQVSLLRKGLDLMPRWSLVVESRLTNKGAFLIAQSATCLAFAQSYVAVGLPMWLSELFEFEKR